MNFDPTINPTGDMVPDLFELFVLVLGLVCVMVIILGPLRLRDRYAELEEQALKFSHKKQPGSPAAEDAGSRTRHVP